MNDIQQIERKGDKVNGLYFTAKNKKGSEFKSLSQKVYIIRPKTSISRFRASISSTRSVVSHQTAGKIHAKA